MSAHDTHNPDIENSGELKSKTSFKASFWFVIILVGLFIAALNFVKVIGNDHEEGHEGHGTEQTAEGHEAAGGHEAASHEAAGHETEATAAPAADAHATADSTTATGTHH